MTRVFIIVICMLGLISCQPGGGGIPGNEAPSRYVQVFARLANEPGVDKTLNGNAPLEVAAILNSSFSAIDPNTDDAFRKVELNFGDSSGWVDYTDDLHTKWWKEPLSIPPYDADWMTHHTYENAGDYVINGRVTYWDGEVIYAREYSLVTVQVTTEE